MSCNDIIVFSISSSSVIPKRIEQGLKQTRQRFDHHDGTSRRQKIRGVRCARKQTKCYGIGNNQIDPVLRFFEMAGFKEKPHRRVFTNLGTPDCLC